MSLTKWCEFQIAVLVVFYHFDILSPMLLELLWYLYFFLKATLHSWLAYS